jgi:Domain of unknown function (DUF4394)/Calx-beta domain
MKLPIRPLALTLALLLAPSAWAVGIYGLTTDNRLLLIDSEVPARISSVRPIAGLDAGDNLVGIDVRPATGQLYALGRNATLYTINPVTAVATKVADLAADPADTTTPFYPGLTGTNFGIDFNPVVDRLRVVSNTDENLRIHPVTGLVNADVSLTYAAAPDRNAGANPNVVDVAYTNNFSGATTTTLFGIDDTSLDIVTINPPNSGVLNSPANPAPRFGNILATHAGYDIAPDGTGYVVGVHPTEFILAVADPATGAADSRGPIGDGTIPIRDIAVAPTISFSAPVFATSEAGGSATITVKREGFVNVPASVDFTTHSETASAASDYTTTSGVLNFPSKPVATPADTRDTLTFQVPIINDVFPEEDEFLDLILTGISSGQGIVGFPDTAALRINANDRTDRVGPRVEFVGLTGPSRGITGVVIHFSEDMDPVTVVNLANYRFSAIRQNLVGELKPFTAAVYDPVDRKVTLSLAPFVQTGFRRLGLRIKGGTGGVTDLAGNLLDGDRDGRRGGDALQIFGVFSGTTLQFRDRDGDLVNLSITGLDPAPGKTTRLDGVLPIGGPETQLTQFWILDPVALVSTVNGSVVSGANGDGLVVLAEIIGLDKKELLPIVTNPAFRFRRLTFSPNATGTR